MKHTAAVSNAFSARKSVKVKLLSNDFMELRSLREVNHPELLLNRLNQNAMTTTNEVKEQAKREIRDSDSLYFSGFLK